jgi:Arc/MetJ-type ribon-helix-helix transcriptional regulator
MTIHLTPEKERRLRAVLSRGAYKSVEEVVEAALTAVEQRTRAGFRGNTGRTRCPAR